MLVFVATHGGAPDPPVVRSGVEGRKRDLDGRAGKNDITICYVGNIVCDQTLI